MNTRDLIIRFLLLFFLGLGVYYNSFSNKFLIDDYSFLANPATSSTKFLLFQFSPYQHFDQFADPEDWLHMTYYRPLAHIVPAICYTYFGEHFWRYHAFNLVLFITAAFLIYLCILRISKSDPLALLVSIFYIIHPINGIVVNYITASVFALQVIFITASILCFWESLERKENRPLYYVSLVFMALALLCHETSIMLPFYIGAVIIATKCLDFKKAIKCLIPYFLILLVYLVFRSYFVSLNDIVLRKMAGYQMNFFEYIATLFVIISWYIGQLLFPHGIVLVWPTPVIRENLILNDLGFLALCSLFAASFVIFRRNAIALMGLIWFLIGFLPMFVAPFSRPYDGVDMEPHWFVFSVIGFFILIAYASLSFYSKIEQGKKWLAWVLLFCLGASLINISHAYNRLWFDEGTYCRYWSSQLPYLKSIHNYLGHAYSLQGNWEKARKEYLLSLMGNKKDLAAYSNLGGVEKKMGHFKEAQAYYQMSLRILPNSFEVYANLGSLYLKFGKLDKAQKYYEAALIRKPDELPTLGALISIALRKSDMVNLNKYADLYIEKEKDPQALIYFGKVMAMDHFSDIAMKSYRKAKETQNIP